MCKIANARFWGSLATDPFHYIKFGLTRLKISRGNGLPIAGTPVDARNNSRLYHNTLTALGSKKGGNGIQIDDFDAHFVLKLDLTSSQEASKSRTLFPELTRTPITLKFSS